MRHRNVRMTVSAHLSPPMSLHPVMTAARRHFIGNVGSVAHPQAVVDGKMNNSIGNCGKNLRRSGAYFHAPTR